MVRRPDVRLEALQVRWQDSPLKGGLLGILWVTLAAGVMAAACAVIALVVTLVY